ncbi:MAG: dephospho-CoA kinase [Dehalococcoidia bacterium]|nr:MAG: dephospho-CoA kinase [Dehalococcoidia bacterium]
MLVVAIVGMAGAGKSEVSRIFESKGFARIRFGDATDEELKKQGLTITEENERRMRESLRQRYGMQAYAMLNLSKIDLAVKTTPVVVDGLYSWEEYTFLSNYYHQNFRVVAVWASPATRYARLSQRPVRPLTLKEAYSRDESEIVNLNKGGPIAMADFTIINESSLKDLEKETKKTISGMEKNP